MTVQTARIDDVVVVRLDQPDVLNALDGPMVERLLAALTAVRHDDLRGLVLCGAGGAFCSGANMKAVAGMDRGAWASFIETIQEVTRVLRSLPFPTVAAIEKVAVGGGFELAIACDFRVAGRTAQFSFPEVSRGLVVTSAASRLLPLLVGLPRARQLLFLSDGIDGAAAEELGLVDELCVDGAAEQRALALLARIGQASFGAVAEMRALLEHAVVGDLAATYDRELEASIRCFDRPDAAEGVRAFLERRNPDFTTDR